MRSLRLRLRAWVVVTTTVAVGAVTAAGSLEERRQIRRAESAYIGAFLEHLAAMPELRSDSSTVQAHLGALSGSLARAGGKVALVALKPSDPVPLGAGAVACQRLSLSDGEWALHYWSDGRYVRAQVRRALLTRLLLAVGLVLAIVAGLEWMLRRNLLRPLSTISRQIERITEGGGWLAHVPDTDEELQRLTRALRALGPGLEEQTRQWIETERRVAAASVLAGVRAVTLEPLRSAQLELSLAEAALTTDAATKTRLRRAARAVHRLTETLRDAEATWFRARGGAGVSTDESRARAAKGEARALRPTASGSVEPG
ncbi:MAG TPA: hypothetical protein PLP50_07505 [Thermoanaerobaculia bacterium]|nr:hypothetical protein [Thermoanaerobaculia bacterium]HQN08003.1 hypothetical protein [Thermoanaerobaculia bacterium]HQP87852.1 hypothetical protein [Thermoanaerobaculia bacterium]